MSEVHVAIAPSIREYFQEVISEAIRVQHVEATATAASYLVALLCDYAHPDEHEASTFNRPLTFLLQEAVEASGTERVRKLRALGDHTLYALGFFGNHLDKKGIARGYVSTVGSTAYSQASASLRLRAHQRVPAAPDVLAELSAKFDRLAEVLRDVSDRTLATGAGDPRSLIKLYERWLRTGSTRLGEELGAHGIIPTRGSRALN